MDNATIDKPTTAPNADKSKMPGQQADGSQTSTEKSKTGSGSCGC